MGSSARSRESLRCGTTRLGAPSKLGAPGRLRTRPSPPPSHRSGSPVSRETRFARGRRFAAPPGRRTPFPSFRPGRGPEDPAQDPRAARGFPRRRRRASILRRRRATLPPPPRAALPTPAMNPMDGLDEPLLDDDGTSAGAGRSARTRISEQVRALRHGTTGRACARGICLATAARRTSAGTAGSTCCARVWWKGAFTPDEDAIILEMDERPAALVDGRGGPHSPGQDDGERWTNFRSERVQRAAGRHSRGGRRHGGGAGALGQRWTKIAELLPSRRST